MESTTTIIRLNNKSGNTVIEQVRIIHNVPQILKRDFLSSTGGRGRQRGD